MEEIKNESPLMGQVEDRPLTCGEYCTKMSNFLDQKRTMKGIPDLDYQIMISQAGISISQIKEANYSRFKAYISHELGINGRGFEGFDDFVKTLLTQVILSRLIDSRSQ